MSIPVHIASTDSEFLAHLALLLEPAVALTAGGDDDEPPAGTRLLIKGVPTQADLAACPDLEGLVIPWAGLPRATRKLMGRYPHIAIYNLHHNADTVAEMAIGLMFACAKRVPYLDRRLRRGDWRPRYAESSVSLLKGKSALVLGYGAVGKRIASLCCGLGMEVSAVRRSQATTAGDPAVRVFGASEMSALLTRAEVLFVSLPWTPETDGLIGAHELGQLPDGAIVINIGRGSIIDEKALYETLRDRPISAGLDVWYTYPRSEADHEHTRPSDYPFEGLDNVVMTPHLAGHHTTIEHSRAVALAELLNAVGRGEVLPNRVDLERGY